MLNKKIPELGAFHQVIESFSNFDKHSGYTDIYVERNIVHGFNEKGRPNNITEKQKIKGVLIPQSKQLDQKDGEGYWVNVEYKLVVATPYRIFNGDIVITPKGKMIATNVNDLSEFGTTSATLVRRRSAEKFVDKN